MTLLPTVTCARCGDTGVWVQRTHDARSSTISSIPCACRADETPRDGTATWWSLERVFTATVEIPIESEEAAITVDAEVPMSEDNHRLVRRGNRYWPTLVDLEIGDVKLSMHDWSARKLGEALIAAADTATGIDEADADVCGHWYPCQCAKKAGTR